MQYTLLIAALVSLVSAQGFAGVPSCAQNCVLSDLPANCKLDLTCICSNSTFITNISCCVSGACDTAGQNSALAAASSICAGASVTVSLPTAAGCSNGAVAAASSSSISGSSTASGSSSSHSSTITGSSASSVMSAASSAVSSASSTASAASASAASATSRADAGAKMAVQGMGLAGAVLGAVVLL